MPLQYNATEQVLQLVPMLVLVQVLVLVLFLFFLALVLL